MHAPSDMKGKAVLVTGAASGLGRATALAFAEAGADLCIVDLNAEGLNETAASARWLGRQVCAYPADLSKAESCGEAVAAAVESFGRLDALCNIAGILYFSHSTEMTQAQWDKTIAVNLSAPFFLSQAAIPHLLENHGAIVNVTSSGGVIGEAYLAAYCAAKAGLAHMTKAMAMEYIHKPIRINAVAPGGMATGIANNMKMPDDVDFALIKRFTPLRGVVEVEDVAQTIAFLASDAARGFHGAVISIDSGITAG